MYLLLSRERPVGQELPTALCICYAMSGTDQGCRYNASSGQTQLNKVAPPLPSYGVVCDVQYRG
eukprot:3940906-Rhodomonas_salina.1